MGNAWVTVDESALRTFLDENEWLTINGADDPHRAGFQEARDEMFLPDVLNQVNHCLAFLSAFTPVSRPQHSSYGLKHCAEEWGVGRASYISNGAAIAAGTILGLRARFDGGLNVLFGISKPEYDWVWLQKHSGSSGGTRQPQGWQQFLERRHRYV